MTEIKEDRLRVQTLLGVNMVVEAGAGTGKTTLLIDRLCFAVLAQNVPAEKLVALTFTDKAAAEIKTRLIFKLQHVIASVKDKTEDRTLSILKTYFSVPNEEIIQRAELALSKLDRSSISTIHSFCADILKKYPLEAGLTPNAEIDKGQKAARLFDADWNRFLDRELGVSAPRPQEWRNALAEISLEEIKSFAQELCGGKIEHYDYFSHRDLLAKICLQKSVRADELSTLYLNGKPARSIEKSLSYAAASLRRTAAFLRGENLPASPEEPVPKFPAAILKGWEPEEFEEAGMLVQFAQKTVPEKQQLFLLVYGLIFSFVQDVRMQFTREGILSFDDLIVKTRNLLQTNLRVRRELKEAFSVLFIDEFQDTDPVQGELLLFLAEEKLSSAARWQDVKLEPGKLFVVGDPKQSIYRFRGADITAYELFTELILKQGGEKCFLQKNFRSEPEIIETANIVCGKVMVQETAFQPAYVPIFTDKSVRPGAAELALVLASQDAKPLADDYRHNQAQFIAQWVKENVGKLILSNGKKLEYKDIALLTRASTTAGPYLDALRRNGIAFNLEEDKNFYKNQEISDFLNLLRVIDDPDDKIALSGVLRSPLGAFTDEELYQISKRGELSVWAVPQDQTLADFYALLRGFVEGAGRTPLKSLLYDVVSKTFITESCAAAYEGEQTLSNISKLISLAEGYSADTPATLGQFLARAQELMEEELDKLSASLSDDSLLAMSVMTVHKSKGLEFPVVILADISKKDAGGAAKRPAHIFSWQYGMHGLRVGGLCDVNLAFLEEEQKRHARAEEIRILYVALTRAREKLLLVGNGTQDAKTFAALFSQAGLFPDIEALPLAVGAGDLRLPVIYLPYAEPEEFIYKQAACAPKTQSGREIASWKAAYAARQVRYKQLEETKLFLSPSELTRKEEFSHYGLDGEGATLGSVCHKALELFVCGKGANIQTAVALAAGRLDAPELKGPALNILLPFTQSKVFLDALSGEVLACEMPFSYSVPDCKIFSGAMDLVVRKPDGSILIADYKTDKLMPGAEGDKLEIYKPQLKAYQDAAKKLFHTDDIKCCALFVRTFAKLDL